MAARGMLWCAALLCGAARGAAGGAASGAASGAGPACARDQPCVGLGGSLDSYYYKVRGNSLTIEYSEGRYFKLTCRAPLALADPALPVLPRRAPVVRVRLVGCAPPPRGYAAALAALNVSLDAALELAALPAAPPLRAAHLAAPRLARLALEQPNSAAPLRLDPALLAELPAALPALRDLHLKRVELPAAGAPLASPALRSLWLERVAGVALDAVALTRLPALDKLVVLDDALQELDLSATALRNVTVDAPLRALTLGARVAELMLRRVRGAELRGDCAALRRVTLFNVTWPLPARWLAHCGGVRELRALASRGALGGEELAGARALRVLDVRTCALRALPPDWLADAVELRALNLSNNQLERLPSLAASPSLEELWAQNNKLSAAALVPLRALPALRTLRLDDNPLRDLCERGDTLLNPATSPLVGATGLRVLSLRSSGVVDLCIDWRELRQLVTLDLRNNSITRLTRTDLRWRRTAPSSVDLRGNAVRVEYTRDDYRAALQLRPDPRDPVSVTTTCATTTSRASRAPTCAGAAPRPAAWTCAATPCASSTRGTTTAPRCSCAPTRATRSVSVDLRGNAVRVEYTRDDYRAALQLRPDPRDPCNNNMRNNNITRLTRTDLRWRRTAPSSVDLRGNAVRVEYTRDDYRAALQLRPDPRDPCNNNMRNNNITRLTRTDLRWRRTAPSSVDLRGNAVRVEYTRDDYRAALQLRPDPRDPCNNNMRNNNITRLTRTDLRWRRTAPSSVDLRGNAVRVEYTRDDYRAALQLRPDPRDPCNNNMRNNNITRLTRTDLRWRRTAPSSVDLRGNAVRVEYTRDDYRAALQLRPDPRDPCNNNMRNNNITRLTRTDLRWRRTAPSSVDLRGNAVRVEYTRDDYRAALQLRPDPRDPCNNNMRNNNITRLTRTDLRWRRTAPSSVDLRGNAVRVEYTRDDYRAALQLRPDPRDPCNNNMRNNNITRLTRTDLRWRRTAPSSVDLRGNAVRVEYTRDDYRAALQLRPDPITRLTRTDLRWRRTAPSSVDLRGNAVRVEYTRDDYRAALQLRPDPRDPLTTLLLDNVVDCDCYEYWFARAWRERPEHARVALRDLRCRADASAAPRELLDVPLDELLCDMTEAQGCPRGCRCRASDGGAELRCERAALAAVPALHAPAPPVRALLLAGNDLTRVRAADVGPALRLLDVRDNRVAALDAGAVAALWDSAELLLAGNPLDCSCAALPLLRAVAAEPRRVRDLAAARCADGRALAAAARAARDCGSWPLWPALLGALALAAASALAAACLARRAARHRLKRFLFERGLCLRWVLRGAREDADDAREFDAFVSFSHLDQRYADELARRLERSERGERARRLCLHERDWLPGDWIPAQIARSVRDARRTLVLLSDHFLASTWARAELREAYAAALHERTPRLLLLLLPGCSADAAARADPALRAYLARVTYLRWDDPHFWRKLELALPPARRAAPPARPPPPPPPPPP
ncbi:uncharacterized protein [Maniola hyperantus]|uniref:uncharacterized protein n=1 Tax=Aphantopus hyperantus TaxID=2795564 RepID=UPI003747A98E